VVFLLGYAVALQLGWSVVDSLLAGGIVAISSTVIVARALDEAGADRRLREIVFGILIVEDLAAVLLIAVLAPLVAGGEATGAVLWGTLTRLALVLGAIVVAGLLIIPRAIRWAAGLRRPETTLVAALAICFGMSFLTSYVGYSLALGAFLGGALVAESGLHHLIADAIRPVRDLFAAIFFVAVGMLFEPAGLQETWPTALALTGVVIVGKLLGGSLGVFLGGFGTRQSVRAGLALAQIGEFAFVIAGLGAAGATSHPLYGIAVAVATVTAFTTPLLVRRSDALAQWVDRRLPKPVQTFVTLYGSWIDLLQSRRREVTRAVAIRRTLRFVLLDAAFVTACIVATSVAYRRLPFWLGEAADLRPLLRVGVLAAGALLALPFGIGLVRTTRRLAVQLAEAALPAPPTGKVDQAHAPRRVLMVTLQIALVVGLGVPMVAVTLPFVPPYGLGGVVLALLLLLGLAFWRTAADLDSHARAGAELVVHVLAKQGRQADEESFEVVRGMLPGFGTIVPVEIAVGSEAAGRTLSDLNLRGRTGATVVGFTRNGVGQVFPEADTRLQPGDMLALTGTHDAIEAAHALLRARDTSSR
jgi:CPA2 family monovalent cation:H+ antiporter-2